MRKKRKRMIFYAAFIGAILFVVHSISSGIWGEYGGHNLRNAMADYVEENDGEWPNSWQDIEPYHRDPILGVQSTFFVRRYWGVAWEIDPEAILSKQVPPDTTMTPVVYSLRRVQDPNTVEYWDLGLRIKDLYQGRNEKSNNPALDNP
jgi:hypothetical protein